MNTDGLNATEAECAAGRTAPRVSLEDIKSNIAGEFFSTADLMFPGCPVLEPMKTLTVCVIVLKNGFTIIGKSAPADVRNFDPDLGKRLAYEDAVRQVWPLMGYALRQKLHEATMPEVALTGEVNDLGATDDTQTVGNDLCSPVDDGRWVRVKCLELANDPGGPANVIVDRAKAFLGFVTG